MPLAATLPVRRALARRGLRCRAGQIVTATSSSSAKVTVRRVLDRWGLGRFHPTPPAALGRTGGSSCGRPASSRRPTSCRSSGGISGTGGRSSAGPLAWPLAVGRRLFRPLVVLDLVGDRVARRERSKSCTALRLCIKLALPYTDSAYTLARPTTSGSGSASGAGGGRSSVTAARTQAKKQTASISRPSRTRLRTPRAAIHPVAPGGAR
mmetsp:Transcript_133724/g.303320  ORF Transcript_133724/g.303320 Transcript_133724/m.303320 type:complete len:209 (-) Transcript_133724:17-643(-)